MCIRDRYMARVYERQKTLLDPVLGPVERLLYRMTGVDADAEMGWMEYGAAMLIFSLATLLLTYAVERLQHAIPLWNPQHLAAVEPYLAWNTAASFTTNKMCIRDSISNLYLSPLACSQI